MMKSSQASAGLGSLQRRGQRTWRVAQQAAGLGLVLGGFAGCALHYYDAANNTEHVWGFGHLKMRAMPRLEEHPPFTNAAMAYVTGVRTLGLSLGAGQEFAGLAVGWDSRSRVVIAAEDAQFCLLWPSNTLWLTGGLQDLFTLRLGDPPTNFLFQTSPPSSNP